MPVDKFQTAEKLTDLIRENGLEYGLIVIEDPEDMPEIVIGYKGKKFAIEVKSI